MFFKQLLLGRMENFIYIVGDPISGDGAVIDPGWEPKRIIEEARRGGVQIKYILNTHCHPDHVAENGALKDLTGAQIAIHKEEAKYLKHFSPPAPDLELVDGDEIKLGRFPLKVIHTPGHSPGSCCFLINNKLITGDTLFVGSIGRTDFQGGDPEVMYDSLCNRIYHLGDDIEVYPGHDYGGKTSSTISYEKRTNPHLRCRSLEEFLRMQ